MRTLMRVVMPVVTGNAAIKDGRVEKLIRAHMEKVKPEAAYFSIADGKRSAWFVFDMADSSQCASLGEPFFLGLDAAVEFTPCMNIEDLMKGLGGG